MEESSEAHMETDVSSTTDDVLETQEDLASNDRVEMVLLFEDDSNSTVHSEDQTIKIEEDVTSASPTEEKPAEVTPLSTEVSTKSPAKTDVSKPVQKSPVKEVVLKSPQKPATSTSPVKVITQRVITVKEAQCADSTDPTKNETPPEPVKPVVKTTELSLNKSSDEIMSFVLKSPLRVYKPAEKSTLKDVSIMEKSVTEIVSQTEQKVLAEIKKQKVPVEIAKQNVPAVATMINVPVEMIKKNPVEVTKQKVPAETTITKLPVEPTKNVLVEVTKQKDPVEVTNQKVPAEVTKQRVPVETTKQRNPVETTKQKGPVETTKQKGPVETTKQRGPVEMTEQLPIKESPILSSNVNGKVPTAIEKEKTNPVQEQEISMEIDKEGSNSQASDVSEKEHNKSISRELKSLINSAKESKIISECNQLTSKTRKSRTNLDSSVEADKIQGNRRGSNNSQISNSSEKSEKEKAMQKRSMRSQNPEFVSKCKQFMNSVTAKVLKDSDEAMSEDEMESKGKEKSKPEPPSAPSTPKRKKFDIQDLDKQNKLRSDPYCWRCHYIVEYGESEKTHPPIMCTVCPRSFHYKCLTGSERKIVPEKNWVCPDCLQILHAESSETRSPAMKKITLGMLCELLKYALERMMDINGVTPFISPVDRTAFPDYDKYVIHPMDLTQMKQNIADGNYGSTEAFTADAQWILHNSIIFNTCEQAFLQSKLTAGARALVRSCRAEMGEIEACPECYSGAHARKSTWFTDVCSTPHILLWAKLKGFPYWPAKGMTVNSSGLVDVRFFGAHDRAWVPAKDCFLYSEKDPNNFRSKRQDILDSMQEAEQHIRNISRKYEKFVYPPFRTQFDPTKMTEQLKMMIPTFEGEIRIPSSLKEKLTSSPAAASKDKRRSNSKSSKTSTNDGDTSEFDDSSSKKSESTNDISKEEVVKTESDTASTEKFKTVDAPSSPKETESLLSRKRRRSNLEEAVLTVMDTPEKKKKNDDKPADTTQTESCKEEKADKTVEVNKTPEKSNKESTEVSKKTEEPTEKPNDIEPSTSTVEELESLRVTPIKLVALPRTDKQTPKLFTTAKVSSKPGTPKADDKEKPPQKLKQTKLDKSFVHDKSKEKRRHSRRSSRSSINATSTPKSDKTVEKKSDSDSSTSKETKTKEVTLKRKNSDVSDKSSSKSSTSSPKLSKDRTKYDDDTSLAVIARKTRQQTNSGLPTISNVCSLSTIAQNTITTSTTTTNNSKTIEVTIEPNNDKSVFTPTSTENVTTMKDAVSKLQKLRNYAEPMVGRVGVKAFARMTSPNRNSDVQVEVKAEPIDLDEIDEERQMEKMDLMNACKLRPVNQVQAKPQNTRDMRVNKVVVQPTVVAKKTGRVEVRPRAKKTFPSPRRNDGTVEGSSLNGKNSMVYIPIQPPATQAPTRHIRPIGPNAGLRQLHPVTSANSIVNTVTSPLRPTLPTPTSSTIITTQTMANTVSQLANVGNVANIGQVPTTVHTVPLMTSVNGQWMFSLQPVMSVGGLENAAASPVVNGLPPERSPAQSLVTITPNTAQNKSNESTTPSELPRLQQRPVLTNPLDSNASLGTVPPPSSAGPLTAKLNLNAVKLTDFFRTLLEDTIDRIEEPMVQAHALKLQLEQSRWRHQQELEEMKHNHELTLAEMRLALEKEKIRIVNEARKTAQADLDSAVKCAKTKQWCANCFQEAQFYCCWNTSYCDYPCQRAHWPQHFSLCTQHRVQELDNEENTDNRRQSQSESLPTLQKNGPCKTPTLTVGGKLAPTRVYADSAHAPKTSIIVSMVEDTTGNQTMKCVGTYKSPQPTNMQPLIINTQLMNDDNTAKKVVTSGGYLIVGAAGNTSSVVTPAAARRPQAIQYFT